MPDATGLELVAQRVRDKLGDDTVVGTAYHRELATLEVAPGAVREVIGYLKAEDEDPYPLLMSLHGCDYLPNEPRFGVHYELLNMERVERLHVKALLADPGDSQLPELYSCVGLFPTAEFQEREVYDMFGVTFEGHPDLRRILMPEDYEGHPQRRDFPIGGEPVLFTKDGAVGKDYTQ